VFLRGVEDRVKVVKEGKGKERGYGPSKIPSNWGSHTPKEKKSLWGRGGLRGVWDEKRGRDPRPISQGGKASRAKIPRGETSTQSGKGDKDHDEHKGLEPQKPCVFASALTPLTPGLSARG